MTTPTHYQQCGAIGRPILIALGFATVFLDGKCEEAIAVLHHTRNYWELSAFKYLWRAGEKGDPRPDLEKALDCLSRLSPQIGGSAPRDEVLEMIRDASRNVRARFVDCSGSTHGINWSSNYPVYEAQGVAGTSAEWQIQDAPMRRPRTVTVRFVNESDSPACFYVAPKRPSVDEVKDLAPEVVPGSAWVATSGDNIGDIVEVVCISSEHRLATFHASAPVFRAFAWKTDRDSVSIYRSEPGFYHEVLANSPKLVVFTGYKEDSLSSWYLPLENFVAIFAEQKPR